jgi:hypothetical protein
VIRWLIVLLAVTPGFASDLGQMERDLDQIARTATAMVDGDICQRIVTERALEHMSRQDQRDEYAAGDNYDVDDQAFISTKKTLMRLATLADYPIDVNLWLPLDKEFKRIHITIRNRYEMSQFWEWGKLEQPMFPPMRSVLETGKRLAVKQKPGYISVLAPVRNSLGDIIGLVEVVSQTRFDARENVK